MSVQIEGVAGATASQSATGGEKFRGEAPWQVQEAADKFSALMAPSSPDQSAAATDMQTSNDESSKVLSVGDRILQSMQGFGNDFRELGTQVEQLGQDLSVGEAIQIQWHMVNFATQVEAFGKAIGKATQDVDQLVRTQ